MDTASPAEDHTPSGSGARCDQCDMRLARDQRYCVACGARRGPLPTVIARLLETASTHEQADHRIADYGAGGAAQEGPVTVLAPSAAAAALIAILAFGVLVGAAVSPASQSNASAPIVVALSPPTPTTPNVTVPAAPPTTSAPEAEPAPTPTAQVVASAPSTTTTQRGSGRGGPSAPPVNPFALPPIKHVFLIMLSDHGYAAAFGPSSQAPYLAKALTRQGELLPNYYAVAPGELANGIALLSGQGPTPQTVANCPQYVDLTPGTLGTDGQVAGSGCVYPAQTRTLADQLVAKGMTWRAYVEDLGNAPADQSKTCTHPALGAMDADQTPGPGDAQVTWQNPFVYFHSLIDSPSCARNDVGLDELKPDLKLGPKAPSFAYIVPNRCHDGAEQPCAPGQPSGLAAADAFLRSLVPEIERSPAYAEHGLIAITVDQAPQSGPEADSSACCETPLYPNLPASSSGPTPSGAAAAPGTVPTTTTAPAAGSSATGTPTSTIPATAAGPVSPTGGGGQVGLLLISSYVKPGMVTPTDYFNHFSLLRSIEDIFGLDHLGYASNPALPAFDRSVFTASRPAQVPRPSVNRHAASHQPHQSLHYE